MLSSQRLEASQKIKIPSEVQRSTSRGHKEHSGLLTQQESSLIFNKRTSDFHKNTLD